MAQYDGDTYYKTDGEGVRFDGGDTPERKPEEPGWSQARDAAVLATTLGYKLEEFGAPDIHGRSLGAQFPKEAGPSAMQEMVADGMADPMHWPSIKTPGEHQNSVFMRGAQKLAGTEPSALEEDPVYRHLRAESSRERMEAVMQRVQSGELGRGLWKMPEAGGPRAGVVASALARGTDETQATFYGMVNALGAVTGIDAVEKHGYAGMIRNLGEAAKNPAYVPSIVDVQDAADFGIYALEALAEEAPSLALDAITALTTGGAGALTGRALASYGVAAARSLGGAQAIGSMKRLTAHTLIDASKRLTFGNGAKLGAYASMYAQNSGENQMQFTLEGVDAPGTALAVGGAAAALDYLGLDAMLRGSLKGLSGATATPKSIEEVLMRTLGTVATAMPAESLGEMTQALMTELTLAELKPGYEVDTTAVLDAFLKGGVVAGAAGGASTFGVEGLRYLGESTAPSPEVPPAADELGDTDTGTPIPPALTEAPPSEPPPVLPGLGSELPPGLGGTPAAIPAADVTAEAPPIDVESVESLLGEVPPANVTAVAAPHALREVTPVRERESIAEREAKGELPPVGDAAAAGVNVKDLADETESPDPVAQRRALISRLDEYLPGTDQTLRDKLGRRRIGELDDHELATYLDALGVDQDVLPRRKGALSMTVPGAKGEAATQVGPEVEQKYRAQAGRRLAEGLRKAARGVGQKLHFDLTAMADLLGMEPNEAKRSAYSSEQAYREAVTQAVAAKHGSFDGLAKAMDEYSPGEIAGFLEALRIEQPAGFTFDTLKTKTPISSAKVRAEIAARAPTTDKPAPRSIESGKPVQAKPTGAVAGIIENLRNSPLFSAFVRPTSVPGPDNGKAGRKSLGTVRRKPSQVIAELFPAGQDARLASGAAVLLREMGITGPDIVPELREYVAELEAEQAMRQSGTATEILSTGQEPEDGLADDQQAVVATTFDTESDRDLSTVRRLLDRIERDQIDVDTLDEKGNPIGARAYVAILSQLVTLEQDSEAVPQAKRPRDNAESHKRVADTAKLIALVQGLDMGSTGPAQLREDILAVTGLTDEDVTGDEARSAEEAFDAMIDAGGLPTGVEQALRAVTAQEVDGDQLMAETRAALEGNDPIARRDALLDIKHALAGTSLEMLSERQAMRDRTEAAKRGFDDDGLPDVTGKGQQITRGQKVTDKSEQQLSDWTFFSAVRRAIMYFQTPLQHMRAWKQGKGEPSVFDTHDVWVIDFETFFDPDTGYSLHAGMGYDEYINDPRFKVHAMSATRKGEEPLFFDTEEDIRAFLATAFSGDKPTALVAHNAAFDAEVMRQKFGFEPSVWIDTLNLSRAAYPQAAQHSLGAIAARMGDTKHSEALHVTRGVIDPRAELSKEDYAAFAQYARDDVRLTLQFLEAHPPSQGFVLESGVALNARRGIPGTPYTAEHLNAGNDKRGVTTSRLVTAKLKGTNLLHLPFRDARGRTRTMPFDAVALAAITPGKERQAESASEAMHNLLDVLSRMAQGAVAEGIGSEVSLDHLFVPHDDTVIFIDAQKGPVTFGEARQSERGVQSRDAKLLNAQQLQESLRERLTAVEARLLKLYAKLQVDSAKETDEVRLEAFEIWMARLSNERITEAGIIAREQELQFKQGKLVEAVANIGRRTRANPTDGERLSLLDVFNERGRILGDLKNAGRLAKEMREQGARSNPPDEEASARSALAREMNASLFGAIQTVGLNPRMVSVDALIAATTKVIETQPTNIKALEAQVADKPQNERLAKKLKDAVQQLEAHERALELLQLAKSLGRELDRNKDYFYASDVPQKDVDSYLRGDGFTELRELDRKAHEKQKDDGSVVDTNVTTFEGDRTEERTSAENGLANEDRRDGAEQRRVDPLEALFSEEIKEAEARLGVNRLGDTMLTRLGNGIRIVEGRANHRVFDSAIGTAMTHNEGTKPSGTVELSAEISVPSNVLAGKNDTAARPKVRNPKTLGFENKLGRPYAFVTTFLSALRKRNVTLNNVTLLSRDAAHALVKQVGMQTPLGAVTQQALANGGSAYFVHNGRAYILVSPDASNPQAVIEELAHEIGHLVKDQVWNDLLESDRAALEAEFQVALTRMDSDVRADKADDHLLHEWFADQFMRAVIKDVGAERRPKASKIRQSPVAAAIDALVSTVRAIWDAVKSAGEPGIAFEAFAQRLFNGQYNQIGVRTLADSSLRFASGAADVQPGDRQMLNRLRMGVNATKAGWKKGAVPSMRAVLGTVIGQIEAYSPELGAMLFQRANADSRGSRAYEQTYHALANRFRVEKDRGLAEISKAKGKVRKAEIEAAFSEAFAGEPKTEAGRKARALLDNLARLAARAGLRTVQYEEGFPIAVFDREVMQAKRSEFAAMLVKKMKISEAEAFDIITGIVEGPGTLEGSIAPGLPVSAHTTTRAILAAIPYKELNESGWLLKEHEAALQHWTDGMAKRTAWESTFGAFVDGGDHQTMARRVLGISDPDGRKLVKAGLMDQEGRLFNSNAKFTEQLEKIRTASGEQAAQHVLDLIDGVMGRTGQDIPTGLRKTQDFVLAWVNMTVLAFSGVASIPELATSFVRAGGRVGLSDLVTSIREGRRLSQGIGTVLSDASHRIVWQATGEQYQSPLAHKMNYWLFKLNGNQMITNISRSLATGVGAQFLLSAAADGDTAALAQLNIDAATVRAWDRAGRPAPNLAQSAELYAVSSQVADALSQFVQEATVSPSRFQSTAWGNNPWFKIVWHLKHFLYTYTDTILGGIWRDAKRRYANADGPAFNRALMASAPALIFAIAVMPLAAAALELRDLFRRLNGVKVEERSAAQYLFDAFERAGGLGALSFVASSYQQQAEYGVSLFGSLSPTLGKIDALASDYGKDGEIDSKELMWKLRQITPLWSQNKTMLGVFD